MLKLIFFFIMTSAIILGVIWIQNQNTVSPTSPITSQGTIRPATPKATSPTKVTATPAPPSQASLILPNHFFQTFNNCGPATLSMILYFYQQPVSQNILGDEMRPYQVPMGNNDDKSVNLDEFAYWVDKYGLTVFHRPNGDINKIKAFIANNIPVVVRTWLHPNEDIGHFRIIKGYNDQTQQLTQDDSYQGPNRQYSYQEFLEIWQPFNYELLVVVKPDQVAKVKEILGSDQDEQKAWLQAKVIAQTEAEKDPDNVYPIFNLSVASYHLGEYEEAVKYYEQAQPKLPGRMLWYQIEPIQAYQKVKNYTKVFSLTDQILNSQNRAFSELYLIRGQSYLDQDQKDLAKEEFTKALLYNKNLPAAKEAVESVK